MHDENAVEGYRRAIARRGETVIVRRISGFDGNAQTFDAQVGAIVVDYVAKSPVADIKPEGAVTLGGRNVIVLEADLREARFPLPILKNDKVVLNSDPGKLGTGTQNGDEELNIASFDPGKRRIAGAIDIVAVGV